MREGSDFNSKETGRHPGRINQPRTRLFGVAGARVILDGAFCDPEAGMDEEIRPSTYKASLDALKRRITATEKRFEDVKWYIGGASLIFSALTLVLGWNFSGDRKELRDAVNDMKTDVRELEDRLREQYGQAAFPQLALLGSDARPLAGQQVQAEVKRTNDGTAQLSFPWALRNTGKGATGPVWMKLFTQKDMPTFA